MIIPYGPRKSKLIRVTGTQEKKYSLDAKNPICHSMVDLSLALFGDDVRLSDPVLEPKIRTNTIKTRILVHLANYVKFRDHFVMPSGVTQAGIARSLWSIQPIVSYELKRLIESGLVIVKRTHIQEGKRKPKTYSLSDAGVTELDRIRGRIDRTVVPVIDFQGIELNKRIMDMPSLFNLEITVVEVLNYLAREKTLNCKQFLQMVESKRESDFISKVQLLPNLKYFYGREKKCEEFQEWLGSKTQRLLAIKGIAGIGKTTFLAKVIQDNKREWNIFYYTVNEWTKLRNTLISLADFLEKMKKPELRSYLDNRETVDTDDSVFILEKISTDSNMVLIFDNIQKANTNTQDFLRKIINSSIPKEMKLIFCGREMTFLDELENLVVTGNIRQMDLFGLEETSSRRLLAERGVDEAEHKMIYNFTDGHPLALELIDRIKDSSDRNLNLFLNEEIVSGLSIVEKEICKLASIFRYPFTIDALLPKQDEEDEPFDYELDQETNTLGPPVFKKRAGNISTEADQEIFDHVEHMVNRSLLIGYGNTYRPHEILRDFFNNRMNSKAREKKHLQASQYYRHMDNDPARVETLYHLVKGKDHKDAVFFLKKYGEHLIRRGYLQDLRDILILVDINLLSPSSRIHYYFYLAETYYLLGDWELANVSYLRSHEFCILGGERHLMTRTKFKLAIIQANQGEWENAIEEYKNVIELAQIHKQILLESQAVREVGTLLFFMGRVEESTAYCHRGMEIVKKTDNRECLVNSYLLQSALFQYNENYERSESRLMECMQIYRRIGDTNQILLIMNNLSDLYLIQNRWEAALDMSNEQLSLSRSIGNFIFNAFGLINSAESLIRLSEYKEAESRLTDAHNYFTRLNDERMVYAIDATFAVLHKSKKEYDLARSYFRNAINGFKKLNNIYRLPEFLFEYAELEKELGNSKKAKRLYLESLQYAKQINNIKWIRTIEERLDKLGSCER